MNTGSPCGILKGHLDRVLSVAFSPNGLYLASASSDSTMGIWSVKTGDLENVLEEHSKEVTRVAFSADGLFLASSSADRLVKLWNLNTGAACHTFNSHSCYKESVAFAPDSHLRYIESVSFASDSQSIWSASTSGKVILWDIKASGALGAKIGREGHAISAISSSNGGAPSRGRGGGLSKPCYS